MQKVGTLKIWSLKVGKTKTLKMSKLRTLNFKIAKLGTLNILRQQSWENLGYSLSKIFGYKINYLKHFGLYNVFKFWTIKYRSKCTVKSVLKGHPREPKNLPFMSSCPLYTG